VASGAETRVLSSLIAALKRRSSTVVLALRSPQFKIKSEINININVKGDGQECPSHTSNSNWQLASDCAEERPPRFVHSTQPDTSPRPAPRTV